MSSNSKQQGKEESNTNTGGLITTRRSTMIGAAGLAGAVALPTFSRTTTAAESLKGGATIYDGLTLVRDGGDGQWDYAPTVMIGDGSTIKMWWCGENSDSTDSIYYSELESSGWTSPQEVMSPSSNDWDSNHVCDPSVVKGNFTADGSSWDYAMYYTGTKKAETENSIGVAFSNDRTSWHKYSGNPVITAENDDTDKYGAGMPTAYREPGTDDTVKVAFFDSTSTPTNHVEAATDAVLFGSRTDLTADPRGDDDMIGSIAFDSQDSIWYVSTKLVGDKKMFFYKTQDDYLNSTWEKCGEINSSQTGNEKNHNPGWLREPNGDLYEEATTLYKYIYFGTGGSDNDSWEIGKARYLDGWEFDEDDNKEGWISANVSGDSGEPTNGTWKCTADQDDPQFVSSEVAIDASETSTVKVRLANQNDDSNGTIYFQRQSDSAFSESRSVDFTVATDGSWNEYAVDMSTNSDWTGYVDYLRIDPIASGTGDALGIDYVHLDG